MAAMLSGLSASVTRILYLTGFPKELKTKDIQSAFSEWEAINGGFKIKWRDDTSLLIVFNDAAVAKRAYLHTIAFPPSVLASNNGAYAMIRPYDGPDAQAVIQNVNSRGHHGGSGAHTTRHNARSASVSTSSNGQGLHGRDRASTSSLASSNGGNGNGARNGHGHGHGHGSFASVHVQMSSAASNESIPEHASENDAVSSSSSSPSPSRSTSAVLPAPAPPSSLSVSVSVSSVGSGGALSAAAAREPSPTLPSLPSHPTLNALISSSLKESVSGNGRHELHADPAVGNGDGSMAAAGPASSGSGSGGPRIGDPGKRMLGAALGVRHPGLGSRMANGNAGHEQGLARAMGALTVSE